MPVPLRLIGCDCLTPELRLMFPRRGKSLIEGSPPLPHAQRNGWGCTLDQFSPLASATAAIMYFLPGWMICLRFAGSLVSASRPRQLADRFCCSGRGTPLRHLRTGTACCACGTSAATWFACCGARPFSSTARAPFAWGGGGLNPQTLRSWASPRNRHLPSASPTNYGPGMPQARDRWPTVRWPGGTIRAYDS